MVSTSGRARYPVVVLGGGFAGAYCTKALVKHNVDVLLVDHNDFLVYSPLLVEAGTGSVEPRHAVISLRSMVPGAEFRLAQVVGLDTHARVVTIQLVGDDQCQTIGYDNVVVCLGSVTHAANTYCRCRGKLHGSRSRR